MVLKAELTTTMRTQLMRTWKYYHVAPISVRASILRIGLVFDAEIYDEPERAGVYAWTTVAEARRCVREFEKNSDGNRFEIWEVTTLSQWDDDDESYGVFSPLPVPAESVRRFV